MLDLHEVPFTKHRGFMGRPKGSKNKSKLAMFVGKEKDSVVELNKSIVYEDNPSETEEDIVLKIAERFDILYKCTHGATTGAVRSLIVSGAGGVGKTYTVEKILEYAKENGGTKSEVVHGVLTPVNLYKLLHRNRFANNVVVLDDADSIFDEDTALSVLKAALDSGKSRKISWLAEGKSLISKKDGEVPTEFMYEGTMIFITNLDFQRLVDIGKSKMTAHMQALMTRALYLDLRLHTVKDLTAWVRHIVSKEHILVQDGLSYEQEAEVLDFITENCHNLRNLSIRTATKMASFVKMVGEDWKIMAKHTEFR